MATNSTDLGRSTQMSQRDPRDGTSPPAPPTDSPANPIAIAALLSGNPNPTAEQLTVILGAPLSVLLRNKNSILYAKGKKSAGAVEQVGEVTAMKAALARPGEVVAFKPTPTTLPTRPSPPVQPSSKGKSPPASTPFRVEPFLNALMAGGVGCSRWLTMSAGARLNTVRNFFYQLTITSAAIAQPSDPLDLVAAIDGACGVPREVTPVGTNRAALRAWGIQAGNQLQIAGISCDQWINTPLRDRYALLNNLARQNLFSFPNFSWSWNELDDALLYDCVLRAEPASQNPTDSIRARVTAIANCAELSSQDKLQQIDVINRAFPEFNGNPTALYRLALARYDACQPRDTGRSWLGEGFERLTWLENVRQSPRLMQRNSGIDVLNGDLRGMSLIQWVKQGQFMPSTGPDVFDPVQGATGDCWLISAMASVAWTNPTALMRISRPAPNPTPDEQRVFQLGGTTISTNQETPCLILTGFHPIFARGSRLDAQWPGVLEKAFAARELGQGIRPRITVLNNMDTDIPNAIGRSWNAIPLMTGGSLFWYLSWFRSTSQFMEKIWERCDPDGRARVPMCASTYGGGGIVDRAELAPRHVYSVLGWGTNDDETGPFVVLRNPWGGTYAGLANANFAVRVRNRGGDSWLDRMNVNNGGGGCFAISADTFSSAFNCIYGAE